MPKVLIILSDAHAFPLQKKDGTVVEEETGFFLMELAKPLSKLLDAGYEVTVSPRLPVKRIPSLTPCTKFASPEGKRPNVDPLSQSTLLAFLGAWWEKNKENELIARMEIENNLASPRPFRALSDEELASFAGVFVPGGHAPIADLGADPELGRILLHFHKRAAPTGAPSARIPGITWLTLANVALICHGPYALLSTQVAPGSPGFAYKGYKITSWSDTEEKLVETIKGGTITKVESSLREAGADMVEDVGTKVGKITVDREVVSGANPMAAAALGDKFIEMLKAKQEVK